MDSRERVRMAVNHKTPDRVPIDLGSMRSSGIAAIAYNNLRKKLNISCGYYRCRPGFFTAFW
jgi:uroporphyrinogen decarboxylase